MHPKFSIIVAVYNVEKYISECIESVLNQTFSDFELLLVDDESTDESVRVVEEYAQRDERIKILSHPHGGLPSTRNVGLRAASGEYIVILDGDDFFDKLHLERLAGMLEQYPCDMCISNNYIRYWKDRTEYVELFPWSEELNQIKREKQLAVIFDTRYHMPASACLTVYARSFLEKHHLYYDETLSCSEDTDFFLLGISKAENIKFTSHKFYFYRQDNASAMTKNMTSGMYRARMSMYEKWIRYYQNEKLGDFSGAEIAAYLKKRFRPYVIEIIRGDKALKSDSELRQLLVDTQYIWASCLIHIYALNVCLIWLEILLSKIRGRIRRICGE